MSDSARGFFQVGGVHDLLGLERLVDKTEVVGVVHQALDKLDGLMRELGAEEEADLQRVILKESYIGEA